MENEELYEDEEFARRAEIDALLERER